MTVLRTGLIGAGLSRSRFGDALELLCRAEGLTLEFTAIDTAGQTGFDLPATVDRLRQEGWTGVSVTHPWKPAAAVYAGAGMARYARGIGAANLLVFGQGLAGHNTDYLGFLAAWRARFPGRNPGHVAIAGAGGVSRAIAAALLELGAGRMFLWDPAPGLAETLAADLGPRAEAVPHRDAPGIIRAADGLVNATPLGMGDSKTSPFDAGDIGRQSWGFDAVYTPTDTPFLKTARARGLDCLTGFDLFTFMALESFALYTGKRPDPARAMTLIAPLRPAEPS